MSNYKILHAGGKKIVGCKYNNQNYPGGFFGDRTYSFLFDHIDYYDWIENTSPAYINTGLKPHTHWIYELSLKITDSGTLNDWFGFFGGNDDIYVSGKTQGIIAIKNGKYAEARYYYNGTTYSSGTTNSTYRLYVGDSYYTKIDGYNKKITLKVNNKTKEASFSNITTPNA